MTCIVFPGQGSQYLGMAKDFNDNFILSRSIFEEIEDYTKIKIRKIIFENKDEKLDLTQYTQICIFATSYVIFKTFTKETDFNINDAKIMMGHSLGEYTALTCSNKINLKDCSFILKRRGELMNTAVEPNLTGMAALIGKDSEYIKKIIDDNDLNLEIANDNSPIQIVISGKKEDIKNSKDLFLKNNIKKFVELNVSAAFHSRYMLKSQEKLSTEIDKLNFFENEIQIISNYDANNYNDTKQIKSNLKNQMANKVNWTDSVRLLEKIGEKNIVEIGPNKVLSSLINRISKDFVIKSVNKVSDLHYGQS